MDTFLEQVRTQRPEADPSAPLGAWESIYDRHAPAVRRLLRGRVPAGLTEDAVQETFFRAYRLHLRPEGEAQQRTWLLYIARRVAIDMALARRRREAITEDRTVMASRFKQQCLALLDQVEATGTPIVVTKHGRPVARVVPVEREPRAPTMGSVSLLADDDEAYFSTGERWEVED